MAEKISAIPLPDELTTGGMVMKVPVLPALQYLYNQDLKVEGVHALDAMFFDFGSNVVSHSHAPGQMEVCILFRNNGTTEIQVCREGEEHHYPEGVMEAVCIKMTARPIHVKLGEDTPLIIPKYRD